MVATIVMVVVVVVVIVIQKKTINEVELKIMVMAAMIRVIMVLRTNCIGNVKKWLKKMGVNKPTQDYRAPMPDYSSPSGNKIPTSDRIDGGPRQLECGIHI